MKKLLAILLSLMMIASMMPTFAFAEDEVVEEELPDVYTVADFSEGDIVANKASGSVPNGIVSTGSNVSNLNQVDFFGYGENNRSLEWNLQPMEFYVDFPAFDWNEYAYVSFRFYAPVAGQTFNYVYMGPDKFTSGKYYQRQVVTTGGWQVITVPLKDTSIQNAIKASADGKSMGYMIFSNNGWMIAPGTPEQFYNKETYKNAKGETYTYKSILNEKIYFDKIWLEKANVDYLDADSLKNGEDDEIMVVGSYSSPKNAASSSAYSRAYDNARPGGAQMYTKVSINPLTSYNISFYYDANKTLNIDGWNYVNVWVYSPRPQAGGIVMWASDNNTSSQRKVKLEKFMTVNWEGWKLLSYKIGDDFAQKLSATGGDGNPETGDIIELKIGIGGWDGEANQYKLNADGTYSKTGKKINSGNMNRWHTKGEIGIEGAYFSKNKPALANQVIDMSNNSNAPAFEALATDKVLYEASASNVSGTGTGSLNVDTNNERLYNQTAKSKVVNGRYIKEIVITKEEAVKDENGEIITPAVTETTYALTKMSNVTNTFATLYTSPKDADGKYASDATNSGIASTDYINFWMYNPGIKYDQFGNPSEYNLQLYYGNKTNVAYGQTGNKDYVVLSVINNWEGWKLISIPASAFSKLANNGAFIGQINIATSEWVFSGESSTSLNERTHTHTQAELDQGYRKQTSGFNTFVDKEHYFMIDRVWISKEKPVQSAIVATQHGTKAVSPANTVFTAEATDAIGRIDGEFSAYKRVGNEVTDVTDEFSFGYEGTTFTATFGGSALSYDAQYIINWPEFYSVNGNKFEAGSSFYRVKTVAYELGSYTVDQATDSASISMKGNVPANLKDNVIVAAVYDVTDGVKTLANVAIATYNAENGEIKAEITAEAGQTVTFMYLDSTASVKPLAEDVSYTK